MTQCKNNDYYEVGDRVRVKIQNKKMIKYGLQRQDNRERNKDWSYRLAEIVSVRKKRFYVKFQYSKLNKEPLDIGFTKQCITKP